MFAFKWEKKVFNFVLSMSKCERLVKKQMKNKKAGGTYAHGELSLPSGVELGH